MLPIEFLLLQMSCSLAKKDLALKLIEYGIPKEEFHNKTRMFFQSLESGQIKTNNPNESFLKFLLSRPMLRLV